MKVIGLTGGIGSGKSTVARILGELGAAVIDADKVGHEAFNPGTEIWQEVKKEFGDKILAPTGEIDRKKLAEIVFNNPPSLERLNQITHPRMYKIVEKQIEEYRRKGAVAAVLEAALLIEAKWTPLVDETWVTYAPEPVVIKRVQARSGLSEHQALARIRSQMTLQQWMKYASVVINNDGDLDKLKAAVKEQWDRLLSNKKAPLNA
jgi:dephospho-CoA kinase